MARENEIVAIFENETATGKKVLKGKTIRDVAAGTKVILWPVDRTENAKRPAFRLEIDTYVPKAKEEKSYDDQVEEFKDSFNEPEEEPPF